MPNLRVIVVSLLALVGSACVADEASSSDPSGGKGDNGFSCPSAQTGWRTMATYVPPAGTNPRFEHWTADGVWTGSEAFFVGIIGYNQQQGCPTPFCWRNEAAAYDPATNTWRTLASPYTTDDRQGLFSQWTGSEWILFGGYYKSATDAGMDGRRYDPATDTWTDIPKVPLPYLREASVAWSPTTEELIVFGGVRLKDGVTTPVGAASYEATSETWAWSLATNTWRSVADSPLSPRQASHAAFDGRNIVFAWGRAYPGPAEEYRSIPGVATYEPVSETWTMLAEPAVDHRMTFADVTIGGAAGAFWGGHPALGDGDFWLTLHDGAAWDRMAGAWQTITDPGLPGTYRSGHATWSAHGKLYVSGGENYEDDGMGTLELPLDGAAWDFATATWQPLPPAPTGRAFASTVWTGCDAIVFGGGYPLTNTGGMILRP